MICFWELKKNVLLQFFNNIKYYWIWFKEQTCSNPHQKLIISHVDSLAKAPPTAWRHGRALSCQRKAALVVAEWGEPAMASLRELRRYGLSCGENNRTRSNSTLYHVKLTDTAIRALEAFQNLKVASPPFNFLCTYLKFVFCFSLCRIVFCLLFASPPLLCNLVL